VNQHVVYEAADGHLHELYYPLGVTGATWAVNDLTESAGAPAPVAGSALTSWADVVNQHVVYEAAGGHVHELYYPLVTGSQWEVNDLMNSAGAPAAMAGSALTSWVDPWNQHVVYEAIDGHVHELYYPHGKVGASWAVNDLTNSAGAPAPVAGSALTSWADEVNQHVVYEATGGNVYELYYPLGKVGATWVVNDLTNSAAAPAATAGSALTSWADPVVLSNNINAVLVDNCNALQGLEVKLVVTEDLVTADNLGFTLQLNCYPPPGVMSVGLPLNWIQFVLYVSNNPDYNEDMAWYNWQAFSLGATGWPDGEPAGSTTPTQPVPPFQGPPSKIVDLPSNQVPKGSTLTIGLTTDPSSQAVTQATFTVQLPGAAEQYVTLPFPAYARFPIAGFQVDLVGPGNGSTTTFTSGEGELTYSVSVGSLSILPGGVGSGCGQYADAVTGEHSNVQYGAVTPGSGPTVSQSLTIR
jgi:hypothetical protein